MDIIYLRVSKEEEGLQDIDSQKVAILKKFELNIENCYVFKERGSAYDLDKVHKRGEFLRLINEVFDAEKVTIKDIFLRNIKIRWDVKIYVWDYQRLMRNLESSLILAILTNIFKVSIYSCKEGKLKNQESNNPTERFVEYIRYATFAYSSEQYSYTISTNIKKSISEKKGIKIGTKKDPKGRKWGRRFIGSAGNSVIIDIEKINILNKRIISLHKKYLSKGYSIYYNKIIDIINREFNLKISKTYISKLKPKI